MTIESRLADLKEHFASRYPLPGLRIGDKEASVAIVQGGMGVGISLSNLAAAVAREGGIGVIAANAIGMTEADYYDDPSAANVRAIRDAGVQVVPIVSSGRAARLIYKAWEKHYTDIPDGAVVEGPRAGGHLGFKPDQIDHPGFQLERIVPEVVEALEEFRARWARPLPVIAAGGIFTGEDIYRILKLGAKGVQMGTRFVATYECDADVRFKEAYLACREEDILIIQSPVGMPGRAIRGPFLEAIARGEKKLFRCPSRCLESCGAGKARYCISEALDSARKGDLENGFAFCGANAHRVEAIVSVKQLIAGLKQGFALACLAGALKAEVAKRAEALKALKGEYEAILDAARAKVRTGVRRMADERAAGIREEKALFRERLTEIRAEYIQVKTQLRELRAELGTVLTLAPSLAAV